MTTKQQKSHAESTSQPMGTPTDSAKTGNSHDDPSVTRVKNSLIALQHSLAASQALVMLCQQSLAELLAECPTRSAQLTIDSDSALSLYSFLGDIVPPGPIVTPGPIVKPGPIVVLGGMVGLLKEAIGATSRLQQSDLLDKPVLHPGQIPKTE